MPFEQKHTLTLVLYCYWIFSRVVFVLHFFFKFSFIFFYFFCSTNPIRFIHFMIIFSLKSANLGQKRKRTRIEIDQFPFDQINAYNISPQHGRKFLQIFFIF